MNIRRIIMPIMTMIILTSQLMGCSVVASAEMVSMIDKGQSITIEVAQPKYDTAIKGTQADSMDWVQVDNLKSYSSFRADFDKALNVNTVTENGANGKSGCIFVDASGDRNGNTTLMDALRNKVFATKYWSDNSFKDNIAKAADKAYTDVSGNETYGITGAFNAYFNLIPNATNPEAFNPTESMSRELFYSMLYRATNPVQQTSEDQSFDNAVGGQTNFTAYAQGIDEYGFLSVTNKSLDGNSYKGSISRAEAVYMIVNKLFPDELSKVTGKEAAFKDTKNAEDLALLAGFKTKQADGTIVGKDRWQSYTLAYMLQHPNDGMQEELYKAMVVAKAQGIISGDESRWDEPVSNSEAIQMVVNSGLALNQLHGYQSDAEYGKINPAKFTVMSKDGVVKAAENVIKVTGAESEADPSKVLSSGITLGEAKHKIDSIVAGIKALGDTVDNNMDYINKQCEQMGTTYDEIKRLPETATQTQAQGAPVQQTQTQAPAKVNPKHDNTPKQEVQQQAPAKTQVSQPASSGSGSSSGNKYKNSGVSGKVTSSSDGSLSQSLQQGGN